MKSAVRNGFIGLLVWASALALPGKNLADYRVGDLAETDLLAPLAVDVPVTAVDPIAAAKVPVVFRDFPHYATNAVAQEFTAVFQATHEKFTLALQQVFARSQLDEQIIGTLEYKNLLAGFNLLNRSFPVANELADQWALGGAGTAMQTNLLARLLAVMHRPVCADEFVLGFGADEKVLAVPVAQPQAAPTFSEAENTGKLIAATNLTSVSRLQMLFRHSFPKDEQALAGAYANFLRPVCAPDMELTRQFRARAATRVVGSTHFAAGQIIARRGAVLDEKALAVIAQIQEASRPVTAPAVVATLSPAQLMSPSLTDNLSVAPTASPISAAQFRNYLGWLIAVVTGFVAASVIAIFMARRTAKTPATILSPVIPEADYAPQISQAVKAALTEELAALRLELLQAQQPNSPTVFTTGSNGHAFAANSREQCVAGLLAEAETLFAASEYEKSLKCFEAVLTLQPEQPSTLVKMGNALERLGRTDEAIDCFDRAIAVDDTLIAAHLQKGGLFNRLSRHQEAAKCFEQALLKQRQRTG